MKLITLVLAEDHPTMREALQALLNAESDFALIGSAENGRQAVEMARNLAPDVLLMDIGMPLLNGLEATRMILETTPRAKILMLSGHEEDAYVERALALGASGYVVKKSAFDLLPDAIRAVHIGDFMPLPNYSSVTLHEYD